MRSAILRLHKFLDRTEHIYNQRYLDHPISPVSLANYFFQYSFISLHQMTPLHWATWADVNVVNDIMKSLVDHGADVNIKDDEGVSEC